MRYYPKSYGGRRTVGITLTNLLNCAWWLARNKDKKVLFATTMNEEIYKYACQIIPHIMVKKVEHGVSLMFPKCER